MLLIVLIVFYLLGCIVKMILDSNFKIEEKEATDGEAESEQEGAEENANDKNSEADGEDEHKDE